MPDFFCSVIDAGTHTITLADDAGSFQRIQFSPNPEDRKAMLAIGLVAMTSERKVWVRVDAASEGSTIQSMSLV